MTEKHEPGMAGSAGGSLLTKSREKVLSSGPSDGEPMVRMVTDGGKFARLGSHVGHPQSSAESGSLGVG